MQTVPSLSHHVSDNFEKLFKDLTIDSGKKVSDQECRQSDNCPNNTHPNCVYDQLHKSKYLSESLPLPQMDETSERGHQSFEDHHFQQALNQGVFDSSSTHTKRERKRSFRRVRKKSQSSYDSFEERPRSGSAYFSRPDDSDSGYRQLAGTKVSPPKQSESFRQKLSNCGINLQDADDKMDIERIHQLHQRLFTGLKIRGEGKVENDVQDWLNNSDSPSKTWVQKRRCASSIN